MPDDAFDFVELSHMRKKFLKRYNLCPACLEAAKLVPQHRIYVHLTRKCTKIPEPYRSAIAAFRADRVKEFAARHTVRNPARANLPATIMLGASQNHNHGKA